MTPDNAESMLHEAIAESSEPGELALDVGAGTRVLQRIMRAERIVSIDVSAEDLWSPESPVTRGPVIVGFAETILPLFDDHRFDVAFGLDFIEHLPRGRAIDVIEQMKRVARRVRLFVPEGEHPQDGTATNPWQAHRSTWRPHDLELLGFDVLRWPEFHSAPGKDRGALWCEWPSELAR